MLPKAAPKPKPFWRPSVASHTRVVMSHRQTNLLPAVKRKLASNTSPHFLRILNTDTCPLTTQQVHVETEMTGNKILVLGSGMVAKPCVDYLLRDNKNSLTIGQSCMP